MAKTGNTSVIKRSCSRESISRLPSIKGQLGGAVQYLYLSRGGIRITVFVTFAVFWFQAKEIWDLCDPERRQAPLRDTPWNASLSGAKERAFRRSPGLPS